MLLTFSRPEFEQKIIDGTKRTTIRADIHNRWKVGAYAHIWMHNPRNVSKNPRCFAIGRITRIDTISIYPKLNNVWIRDDKDVFYNYETADTINEIARLDGFKSWEDMKTFFPEVFHGKRLHFEIHTIMY